MDKKTIPFLLGAAGAAAYFVMTESRQNQSGVSAPVPAEFLALIAGLFIKQKGRELEEPWLIFSGTAILGVQLLQYLHYRAAGAPAVGAVPGVLQYGDIIQVKGRLYEIQKATAKGKNKKAIPVDGRPGVIQFGAQGYTIEPGTEKGNRYCSRSWGIAKQHSKPSATANDFSRIDWSCKGKKSKL